MTSYLPVIIGAVIIIAILLWWLLARNGAQKTVGQSKDIASSPPAAPVAKATAAPKLMDDPAPAKKTVKAKVKAPLKAAATQGTGAGQWSARKAQLVAKKYKASGGGYRD
jgi:hypothetical protein